MLGAGGVLPAVDLEKPPAKLKSEVWQYFGFKATTQEGVRTIHNDIVVCRSCFTEIKYRTGTTTNMKFHLERHHAGVSLGFITGQCPRNGHYIELYRFVSYREYCIAIRIVS